MDNHHPSLNPPRNAGDVFSLTAAHLNKPVISGRLAPDALQSPALPARRQRELLRLIHEHGRMRVTELAGRLNVSGYTIRRDLDCMARRGLITRTYGGAVAADGFAAGRTRDFASRMDAPSLAKRRIARAACKLIGPGETLIVGGGSTTRHFGEALPLRGLTIVTNNVSFLTGLAHEQKTYLLGGQYHHDTQAPAFDYGRGAAGRIGGRVAGSAGPGRGCEGRVIGRDAAQRSALRLTTPAYRTTTRNYAQPCTIPCKSG